MVKFKILPSKFNFSSIEVLLLAIKGNINKFIKDDIIK